jgi:hypothetical protein
MMSGAGWAGEEEHHSGILHHERQAILPETIGSVGAPRVFLLAETVPLSLQGFAGSTTVVGSSRERSHNILASTGSAIDIRYCS